MATPEVHSLGHTVIADHSFSKSRNLLAITRESNVELYSCNAKKYTKISTLTDHDKTVTSVDISADGKIVTCSQDRNALVWEQSNDGTWKPSLVLLRINRAATTVRWSPDGKKFAVGSGARAIAVCYFEPENDWWVSKHLKKPIRSTILSVDWHPNSVLLAAGSTDGTARVFSAFIKSTDARPEPSVWGERLPFQTLCGEFTNPTSAWVHDVKFSPSGNSLAYVAHDSSITVVYPSGPDSPPKAVINLQTSLLPFETLVWTSESQIAAAGFDCHPVIFEGDQSGWRQSRSLDDPANARKHASNEQSALNMFRQMDLKGSSSSANEDTTLPTIHQNTILTLRPYSGSSNHVTQISSTGVDGKLVIFPL